MDGGDGRPQLLNNCFPIGARHWGSIGLDPGTLPNTPVPPHGPLLPPETSPAEVNVPQPINLYLKAKSHG